MPTVRELIDMIEENDKREHARIPTSVEMGIGTILIEYVTRELKLLDGVAPNPDGQDQIRMRCLFEFMQRLEALLDDFDHEGVIEAAAAILRATLEHGDLTDKQVTDAMEEASKSFGLQEDDITSLHYEKDTFAAFTGYAQAALYDLAMEKRRLQKRQARRSKKSTVKPGVVGPLDKDGNIQFTPGAVPHPSSKKWSFKRFDD